MARPVDKILLFYTDKSPNIHMDMMDFLQECRADVQYIHCYRVGSNCDNALDFQLVSMLGYLIHENMTRGIAECYFLVSRDGGFDSVIDFWRRKNIFIQRLVSEGNPNQNVAPGPMLDPDCPSLNHPLAVKPNFAVVRKCGNAFRTPLANTEYFRYCYDIAKVFVPIWNMKLPADKFALRFRNALSTKYGRDNSIYKYLKPTIEGFRASGALPGDVHVDESVTASEAPVVEKKAEPIVKDTDAGVDVDNKSVLTEILSRREPQECRSAIAAVLPGDMKSMAGDIMKLQALSVDKKLEIWQANYVKMLKEFTGTKFSRLPGTVRKVDYKRWPKIIREDILRVLSR